jgi:predicted transcriptional regulator
MGVKLKKLELKVAYTNTIIDQVKTIGVMSKITGMPIENTNLCITFVIYKKFSISGIIMAEEIKYLYPFFLFLNLTLKVL